MDLLPNQLEVRKPDRLLPQKFTHCIDISILQQTEPAAVPLLRSLHPRTLLRAGGARAAPGVQAAAPVQRRRRLRLSPAATVSVFRERFNCAAAVRVRQFILYQDSAKYRSEKITKLKVPSNVSAFILTELCTRSCLTKKESSIGELFSCMSADDG